jgi:hypothetical protein
VPFQSGWLSKIVYVETLLGHPPYINMALHPDSVAHSEGMRIAVFCGRLGLPLFCCFEMGHRTAMALMALGDRST